MRYFFVNMIISIIVISANSTLAQADFRYCELTTLAINNYEPIEFATNNNLLRKPGQEANYCGEAIIIYGQVLDQNCVPVAGAKVNAWQASCNRKYPYQPLKEEIVDLNLFEAETKLSFTGNGTAITNNKGEFYFVTIYPPVMHDLPPHINVRLNHESMEPRQVRLILQNHRVKNIDQESILAKIAVGSLAHSMQIYKFNIVIPATQHRKIQ